MTESEREQAQLLELIGIMAGGISSGELDAMLVARKLYLEAARSKKPAPVPMEAGASVEKLSMSVYEAAHAVGISRRAMLKCLSLGDLPSFKVGNNQLIMVTELTSWLNHKASSPEEA